MITFLKRHASASLFALILFAASFAHGQGAVSTGPPVVVNQLGVPLASTTVSICTSATCGVLAPIYTDVTLGTQCTGAPGTQPLNNSAAPGVGTGCSNPGLADNFGNVVAYSAPGVYFCQYSGPTIVTKIIPCAFPGSGNGGGSPGAPSLSLQGNNAGTLAAVPNTAVNFTSGQVSFLPPGVFTNTQSNLYVQSLVNGLDPTVEYHQAHGVGFTTESITAGLAIPGSAAVGQATGISSWVTNASAGTVAGVGIASQIRALAIGSRNFGANFISRSTPGLGGGVTLYGVETDINPMNNADTGFGNYVTINGLATGTFNGSGNLVSSTQLGLFFSAAYDVAAMSANHAFRAAPNCTSGTCGSPDIELQSMNGGTTIFSDQFMDGLGNHFLSAPAFIPNMLGRGPNGRFQVGSNSYLSIQAAGDAAEQYPANTGLRSAIIETNYPEIITTQPFAPNFSGEMKFGTGLHATTCLTGGVPNTWVMRVPWVLGSGATLTGTGFVNNGSGDMSQGTVLCADSANWVPPLGVPTITAPVCNSTGGSIPNTVTTVFWQVSTVRNVDNHPGATPAPGISMPTAEQTVTCGGVTNTNSIAWTSPSTVGTAPFDAKDYLIALSTVSGAEVVQPNVSGGGTTTCGSNGTVDTANGCKMSFGATTTAIQSGVNADRPLPLADLSNCMFYLGPRQTISFAMQFRDVTIDGGVQTTSSPNEAICNYSGQELTGSSMGNITIHGSFGGYNAGATGTAGGSALPFPGGFLYWMPRTPNSKLSGMQISGGPTATCTGGTFIPVILDGRYDAGGLGAGTVREFSDFTVNPKGTTCTVPENILVTGGRARVNFFDGHMELNTPGGAGGALGTGILITNGAWASATGVEGAVSTTSSLFDLSPTGAGFVGTAICAVGTANSTQAKCLGLSQAVGAQPGTTFKDETLSPIGLYRGYQGLVKGGQCLTTGVTGVCTNNKVNVMGENSMMFADTGTCTMAAGTCAAQTLSHTYQTAPFCFATWTGGGALAGQVKVPSTTTTVTPASSNGADTAVVNWSCQGY
jgi:hypothetical protein